MQIPQADEQQRLLAKLLHDMLASPAPRWWYLPRGLQAAVVMTHDEHGGGDVRSRLNSYLSQDAPVCNVQKWECVRASTYMYTNVPLTNAEIVTYTALGFEFGLHLNTGCADWTPASLQSAYASQIPGLLAQFPGIKAPMRTQRTHCIAWSDWATQPKTQVQNSMRLDTNYYFWPPNWILDRPGLFTGSGIPMRFADLDGTLIDNFQATTQMTDESGQSYPNTINTLLNNAVNLDYVSVLTTNFHTDGGSNAANMASVTIAAAKSRGIPIISAEQLLDWIDARQAAAFQG